MQFGKTSIFVSNSMNLLVSCSGELNRMTPLLEGGAGGEVIND
jgi:hypothetical protein